MDLYLEQYVENVIENLEYRNGIFTGWDYATKMLIFLVSLPFLLYVTIARWIP